jgi:hypothetical protein
MQHGAVYDHDFKYDDNNHVHHDNNHHHAGTG